MFEEGKHQNKLLHVDDGDARAHLSDAAIPVEDAQKLRGATPYCDMYAYRQWNSAARSWAVS